MQRAFKEAGIQLPRTSREQWYADARVLDPGDLRPGDLVFGAKNLSDPGTIYHVGMFIGAGYMIVAPYTRCRGPDPTHDPQRLHRGCQTNRRRLNHAEPVAQWRRRRSRGWPEYWRCR
jgi:cell wall-associated NlpC family hydrolase